MEPPKFEVEMQNQIESLAGTMQAVEEYLIEYEVEQDIIFRVILAVEELVTNTIKYAYDDNDSHPIRITVSLSGGNPSEVKLCVEDDGHPFDPSGAPPPDFETAPEERDIGGLGLHLLREMSQDLEYERLNHRNYVRMTFSS
jgi:anti-sigma regulatory factor (Ser/Thr protein kinase)